MDADIVPTQPIVTRSMPKGGRPVGSTNLHSKYPSSIATRLKAAGIDWIVSFGAAIKSNDKQLLTLWLRLLPYLIVTQGHKRVKHFKGRASKAALQALDELEKGE
jgi:hypothetical protein